MKSDLRNRAFRLYREQFGVNWYKPDYISYAFIPMFRRMGYVWIHISSVVRYCHKANPDQFGTLNTFNIIESLGYNGYNPRQVLNNGRDTRSFRLIKQDDFEAMTGMKLDADS